MKGNHGHSCPGCPCLPFILVTSVPEQPNGSVSISSFVRCENTPEYLDPELLELSEEVVIRKSSKRVVSLRQSISGYLSNHRDTKSAQTCSNVLKSDLKHQPASFKAEVDFKLTFTKDRGYW